MEEITMLHRALGWWGEWLKMTYSEVLRIINNNKNCSLYKRWETITLDLKKQEQEARKRTGRFNKERYRLKRIRTQNEVVEAFVYEFVAKLSIIVKIKTKLTSYSSRGFFPSPL